MIPWLFKAGSTSALNIQSFSKTTATEVISACVLHTKNKRLAVSVIGGCGILTLLWGYATLFQAVLQVEMGKKKCLQYFFILTIFAQCELGIFGTFFVKMIIRFRKNAKTITFVSVPTAKAVEVSNTITHTFLRTVKTASLPFLQIPLLICL